MQSRQHVMPLACPACGHVSDFTALDVIDADADPELAEKVFSGEAFRHVCAGCGKIFPVRYPMLYVSLDMKLSALLLTDKTMLDAFNRSLKSAAPEGVSLRAVTTPERLQERIMIFDQELDDRAVILLESAMLREMDKNKVPVRELFFSGTESPIDGNGEDTIVFCGKSPDGETRNVSWPVSYYRKMRETFTAALPEEPGYRIYDAEWAARFAADAVVPAFQQDPSAGENA